jgi:hypothetical protein
LALTITPATAASAEPMTKVAEMMTVDVHAHQPGDLRVFRRGAHGAAEPGLVHQQHQARP